MCRTSHGLYRAELRAHLRDPAQVPELESRPLEVLGGEAARRETLGIFDIFDRPGALSICGAGGKRIREKRSSLSRTPSSSVFKSLKKERQIGYELTLQAWI